MKLYVEFKHFSNEQINNPKLKSSNTEILKRNVFKNIKVKLNSKITNKKIHSDFNNNKIIFL